MKKFFTLIATALLALTANAETIASWKAGTATGTWTVEQAADGYIVTDGTGKYNNNTTSVNAIKFTKSIVSSGAFQAAYKVTVDGGFKAGDKITVQPFTSMSTTDYTGGAKYANILLYCVKDDAPKSIADITGSAAGALTVTDGHEEAGDPKTFSYTLEADYDALYFGRGGNTNIFVMSLEIVRGEDTPGGGEEEPTGDYSEIASWKTGTAAGTWTVEESATGSIVTDGTGKYNSNTTTVNAVKFTKSIVSSGEFQAAYKVTVEGGFKAGDKITVQPFTAMSTTDYTGGAKYANILVYSADKTQIANLTNSAAGALTVTDGHEEAGDPKTFSYTLEADYDALYFGRGGNTNIFVMNLVIEREGTTAVEAIAENAPAVAKAVKVMKNGKLYIGNYNVVGQQVK